MYLLADLSVNERSHHVRPHTSLPVVHHLGRPVSHDDGLELPKPSGVHQIEPPQNLVLQGE